MEKLALVTPTLDYAEQISAYKSAFASEHLHGGSRLQEMDSLTDWLAHLERESSYATCRPDRSPSSTFLCIRESDQKMVGIVNIRHNIEQEFLLNIAGHIGYSIHPDERQKGYATEQLRLALIKAVKLDIDKVLITAADWNIGSQKTILANGGVYEDTRIDPSDGDKMLRYWIINE
ncbi:Predicted acetyltransferase [Chlamydia trachomatis]|nr:Predicted acetyltransferase [Chlamydia trachomatis]